MSPKSRTLQDHFHCYDCSRRKATRPGSLDRCALLLSNVRRGETATSCASGRRLPTLEPSWLKNRQFLSPRGNSGSACDTPRIAPRRRATCCRAANPACARHNLRPSPSRRDPRRCPPGRASARSPGVCERGCKRAGFQLEEASHLATLGVLVEHLDRDFYPVEPGRFCPEALMVIGIDRR